MVYERKIFETTVIVLAVLLSYSFVPDYGSSFIKLILFVLMLPFLIFIFVESMKGGFVLNLRLSWLLLFFVLTVMLYHKRWDDLNFILKLFVAYAMAVTIKLDSAFEIMCYLSKKLLIPTTLGFVLGSLGIVVDVTGLLSDGRQLYLTPLLTSQKIEQFTRASSYFWEPGVFAYVLNLIVAYKLFRKRTGVSSIKIEFFYLIIAQSAGGLLAFLIMILFYFNKKTNSKVSEIYLFILIFVFFVFLFSDLEGNIAFLTVILNTFTIFFFDRNLLEDASYAARIVDFYAPFYAALDSPWFGFKDLGSFMLFSDLIRGFSAEGITNSWSSIAYRYGYPMMFFYLFITFWGGFKYFKSLLVPFVFIILLASSPVFLNIMTLFFVISCLEMKSNVLSRES